MIPPYEIGLAANIMFGVTDINFRYIGSYIENTNKKLTGLAAILDGSIS